MTSRYRVEYALKSHRRDEFIEWIKGLLAVPFVLHADVENYDEDIASFYHDPIEYDKYIEEHEQRIASECRNRYLEILGDVERLIDNTITLDKLGEEDPNYISASRLRQLVPSVGKFFTNLPLRKAFLVEDERKSISSRRLVSVSFNDVRSILNSAQILALSKIYKNGDTAGTKLKLITFDGDVTLYDDGMSLEKDDPVVGRLLKLLELNLFVGVVTAAGYPGQSGAPKYYERLKGLVDAINESTTLSDRQKENLLIMGGESNYLFRFNVASKTFRFVESDEWLLPLMRDWNKSKINEIMDIMGIHINHLRRKFHLDSEDKTLVLRKERSIGIIPAEGFKILREHLEEIVLSCSLKLNQILSGKPSSVLKLRANPDTRKTSFTASDASDKLKDVSLSTAAETGIQVCAFNGGSDVWVDIGDKSLGIESLQKYLCKDETFSHICPILRSESLHIGDQFASLGANDFKARASACTVWIASPKETVSILDDLLIEICN